jgi:hypothetical protein
MCFSGILRGLNDWGQYGDCPLRSLWPPKNCGIEGTHDFIFFLTDTHLHIRSLYPPDAADCIHIILAFVPNAAQIIEHQFN